MFGGGWLQNWMCVLSLERGLVNQPHHQRTNRPLKPPPKKKKTGTDAQAAGGRRVDERDHGPSVGRRSSADHHPRYHGDRRRRAKDAER